MRVCIEYDSKVIDIEKPDNFYGDNLALFGETLADALAAIGLNLDGSITERKQ